jgi:hypothetical protein
VVPRTPTALQNDLVFERQTKIGGFQSGGRSVKITEGAASRGFLEREMLVSIHGVADSHTNIMWLEPGPDGDRQTQQPVLLLETSNTCNSTVAVVGKCYLFDLFVHF